MESWLSGRKRLTANEVSPNRDRGFESHTLRLRYAEAHQCEGEIRSRRSYGVMHPVKDLRYAEAHQCEGEIRSGRSYGVIYPHKDNKKMWHNTQISWHDSPLLALG